jgi:hypothetical protein
MDSFVINRISEEADFQKTKNCPYCGEILLDIANICRHCGGLLGAESKMGNSTDNDKFSRKATGVFIGLFSIGILFVTFYVWAFMSFTAVESSYNQKTTTVLSEKNNTVIFNEGETVDLGFFLYRAKASWWVESWNTNDFKGQKFLREIGRKPDSSFLMVMISVYNKDKRPHEIPEITLVDESGAQYETTDKAYGHEDLIDHWDSINPGVWKYRGLAVFDVPNSRKYKLVLSGSDLYDEIGIICLSPKEKSPIEWIP